MGLEQTCPLENAALCLLRGVWLLLGERVGHVTQRTTRIDLTRSHWPEKHMGPVVS